MLRRLSEFSSIFRSQTWKTTSDKISMIHFGTLNVWSLNCYPLVMTNIAMGHGHWNSEFSHEKQWFSIAMLVITRGYGPLNPIKLNHHKTPIKPSLNIIKPYNLPSNHHFPMVFLWFSHGILRGCWIFAQRRCSSPRTVPSPRSPADRCPAADVALCSTTHQRWI